MWDTNSRLYENVRIVSWQFFSEIDFITWVHIGDLGMDLFWLERLLYPILKQAKVFQWSSPVERINPNWRLTGPAWGSLINDSGV